MPISDCEVRDPRIRRTRHLLQNALRALMQSKSFDEISVQDITDQATVNRATFYDHYADKFALLNAMVAGGFFYLLEQRKVIYDESCPKAVEAIVQAVCDYLVQIHEGRANCDHLRSFGPLMDAAIATAIRHVLERGMVRGVGGVKADGLSQEMVVAAASSAIYGSAREWFCTLDHAPVEEIVPRIVQLVLPILQAGRPAANQIAG